MAGIDLTQVSSDANAIDTFMQELLDRVVNIYESYNMPIPERRYWTMADPAVDCEQLVVSFIQAYIGAPGDEVTEPRRCNDPRSATIHVSVSRKVPTAGPQGQAPSAEFIQMASRVQAYDAWILLHTAADLDTWATSGGFGLGVIATVETSAPEGGFQTTVLTLTSAIV
jgi:hypothetical protein